MKRIYYVFILLAAGLVSQSCSLNEAPDVQIQCPAAGQAGELAYVLNKDELCFPGMGCFEEAFNYKRCPSGYSCGYDNGDFYCYNDCGDKQLRCGGRCIDKADSKDYLNDNANCGARGMCFENDPASPNYVGTVCMGKSICQDGECLCQYDGMTDNDHCGAKGTCDVNDANGENFQGFKCPSGASCVSGKCQCGTGYRPCPSSDSVLICVGESEFNTSPVHCGGCYQSCDGECSEGKCRRECGDLVCGADNHCGNEDTRCGKTCDNCTANAEGKKVCDVSSGECVACADGNVYDPDLEKCVGPNVRDCGGEDCTTLIQHYASDGLKCIDGQCVVTKCELGFHLPKGDVGTKTLNQACIEDTDSDCGAEHKDCKADYSDPNASKVDCYKGNCVSSECKNSMIHDVTAYTNYYGEYHYRDLYMPTYDLEKEDVGIDWPKCVMANKRNFCGNQRLNCSNYHRDCIAVAPYCTDCSGYGKSVDGEDSNNCLLNYSCGCPVGQHFSMLDDQCVDDTDSVCGYDGVDCADVCNTIEHCQSATCISGSCKVKMCDRGFTPCAAFNTCLDGNKACATYYFPTIGLCDTIK